MNIQDTLLKWWRGGIDRVMNAEYATESIPSLLRTMSDWELARPVTIWSSSHSSVAIVPIRTVEDSQIAEWGIMAPVLGTDTYYGRTARQDVQEAIFYGLESGLVKRDLEE